MLISLCDNDFFDPHRQFATERPIDHPAKNPAATWRTPALVLACGGIVLMLSLGTRHGFGLFLQPMTSDLSWTRETFAFAIALQNLVWGLAQPFAGMVADKFGAARVMAASGFLYALGVMAAGLCVPIDERDVSHLRAGTGAA